MRESKAKDGTILNITWKMERMSCSVVAHFLIITSTKAVLNRRLSRAIGHMESIRRMVEGRTLLSEVLIQLSAVKSAINNTGKVILQDHIQHCIVDAVEDGDAMQGTGRTDRQI